MPSQWKFEIVNPIAIEEIILNSFGVKKDCNTYTDIYYEADPSVTLKIRVFENNTARLIKFKRESAGEVSEITKMDYDSFLNAKIKITTKEILRLHKDVTTYELNNCEILLHSFDSKFYLTIDGEEIKVLEILKLLNLELKDIIPLSFDEIFLCEKHL